MADEIIKVLDALCEKFGVAVDWTSANALPYIQELCGKYINYEIWTSVAWIVLWSVLFVALLIIAIKTCVKANKEGWWCDDFTTGLAIGSVACAITAGIIWAICVPMEVHDIITCLTFPEKMILEYIQSLLANPNS